jgi:hypothetical protein
MEINSQPKDVVLPEALANGGEGMAQPAQLQGLGNKLIYCANRLTAIAASSLMLLSAAPVTSEAIALDKPNQVENVTPASQPQLTADSVITMRLGPNQLVTATTSQVNETDCTEIMDFPLGYYMGEGCSTDTEYKLWGSKIPGFDYAVIVIDGIYKCGWIKSGVLDTLPANGATRGAAYCIANAKSLSKIPYKIIDKLNCAPGACTDGRKDYLTIQCNDKMFRNFASATQSVFNIFPDNNSGFSDYVGEQTGYIYYRGSIVYGSESGNAIDVRNNTTGWAFMSTNCDPQTA